MNEKKFKILFALTIFGYLITHLWSLTSLPIFSDEAIYIRWAQLIIDDPARYLFFALNDGKTPLFIWLLTPFQLIFDDPLFAGRILAVLVGLAQLFVVQNTIKMLKGSRSLHLFGILIFSILPFWYFHHRIALMDGLLVLFIALAVNGVISYTQQPSNRKLFYISAFLTGGLLTKIPAILAFPAVLIFIFSGMYRMNKDDNYKSILLTSAKIIAISFILFLPILFTPSAPQLFSRGGDFLMPMTKFLSGGYSDTIRNIPNYLNYFTHYLTFFVPIIVIAGLFKNPHQKIVHQFFWGGVVFALPIALLGLVVYSRYLLPSAWFFTMAFIFSFDSIIQKFKLDSNKINPVNISILAILSLMLANIVSSSFGFMATAITNPDGMNLVKSDREQYLEKWSSGHGIVEVVNLINQEAKERRILVATEGYFGTLPDGLLTYFHRKNVENISIDGIGQPVSSIPNAIKTKSPDSDQTWLVVNSDRLLMKVPDRLKIAEFCRPNNAPCLQVWNITDQIQ